MSYNPFHRATKVTSYAAVRRARRARLLDLEVLESRRVLATPTFDCNDGRLLLSPAANVAEHLVVTSITTANVAYVRYQNLPNQTLVPVTDPCQGGDLRAESVNWIQIDRDNNPTLTDIFDLSAVTRDTYTGITRENSIDGGRGNDLIRGSEWDDVIRADDGDDTVYGEEGHDDLDGGAGDDTIFGGDGDDDILGGTGSNAEDWLSGEAGNDRLRGGGGDDTLTGGIGDDVYAFSPIDGQDDDNIGLKLIDDRGEGFDALDFWQWGDSITLTLLGSSSQDVIRLDGSRLRLQPIPSSSWTTMDGVYAANGAFPDSITGNINNNILVGWGGNDTIQGGGGNDTIEGGSGDDSLNGLTGDDVINGGANTGMGRDILIGGPGNDFLNGDGFTDPDIAASLESPSDVTCNCRLDEASGAAASRKYAADNLIWTVQDNFTHLYVNDAITGDTHGWVTLGDVPPAGTPGIANVDWEALGFYQDPTGPGYLYIGDIGDNDLTRTSIIIYRVTEPSFTSAGTDLRTHIANDGIERLVLQYPDTASGRARDAEAMMVDPSTGDIYIVSKREPVEPIYARLYRISNPAQLWERVGTAAAAAQVPAVLSDVGRVPFGTNRLQQSPSSIDISSDGMDILLKSDDTIHLYSRRFASEPLATVLTLPPEGAARVLQVPHQKEPDNREAITWAVDGSRFYTLTEGELGQIFRYERGIGNDILTGDLGDDTLVGEQGDDTLSGGAGNDRYVYARRNPTLTLGVDLIMDAAGDNSDAIDFSRFALAVGIAAPAPNLNSTTPQTILPNNDGSAGTIQFQTSQSITNVLFDSLRARQVFLAGMAWGPAARELAGDRAYGFPVPVGADGAAQFNEIAFENIDEISVQLTGGPTGLDRDDLTVTDESGTVTHALKADLADGTPDDGFVYSAATQTATWRLVSPLPLGRAKIQLNATFQSTQGQAFDGEWSISGTVGRTSGDGVPGGNLVFGFNILPGDANQDGKINMHDLVIVRSHFFSAPTNRPPFVDGDFDASMLVHYGDLRIYADNFGFGLPAASPDAGEPPAPAPAAWVQVVPAGFGGDHYYVANGGSNDTLDWLIYSVRPGLYQLSVTWPDFELNQNTSNATFEVYDNSTLEHTVTNVSQQAAPIDFTADGATWERILSNVGGLSPLDASGGYVKVRIKGNGSGRLVADAIRLEPLSASSITTEFGSGALAVIGTASGDTITIATTTGVANCLIDTCVTVNGTLILNGGSGVKASDVTSIGVFGDDGNDTITASAVTSGVFTGITADSVVLRGGGGNDTITGTGLGDAILGDLGDDSLKGGGGDDLYSFCRAGTEDLGDDTIDEAAATGSDTLDFRGFRDYVSINLGSTTQQAQTGLSITLTADSGIENVFGTPFGDALLDNGRPNVLQGGDGDDYIEAHAGDDTLDAGTGSDTYWFANPDTGNQGTKTVVEADNADSDWISFEDEVNPITLNLSITGNQTVRAGILVINLSSATGIENVLTTEGSHDINVTGNTRDNYIQYDGQNADATLVGGGGNDTYRLNPATTDATISITEAADQDSDTIIGFSGGVTINLASASGQNIGGNVTLMLSSGTGIENATGGSGADRLIGNSRPNRLSGFAGNDTLEGAGGEDTLEGFTGDDSLVGGTADDSYVFWRQFTFTDLGADTLVELADGGVDTLDFSDFLQGITLDLSATSQQTVASGKLRLTLNNNATFDNVIGSGAADLILGNSGNNLLQGGGDLDELYNSAGSDTLDGGEYSDIYYLDAFYNNSSTVIVEAANSDGDELSFVGFTSGRALNIATTEPQVIEAGKLVLTLSNDTGIEVVSLWLTSSFSVIGNARDNTFNGSSLNDTLSGGDGNDIISGDNGDDSIVGGAGDDQLLGMLGNDTLDGGTGNDLFPFYNYGANQGTDSIIEAAEVDSDTVDLSPLPSAVAVNLSTTGNQTIISGVLVMNLSSATGIENVVGSASADSLTGNSRNNRLEGRGGNDSLTGGAGDDTYVFSGTSNLGTDLVTEASQTARDSLDFVAFGQAASVNLRTTGNQTVNAGKLVLNLSDVTGIENVIGSSSGDTFIGNDAQNSILGGGGNDSITGYGANDTIDGQAGNDTINGEDGNDLLFGGDGDDSLEGAGNDDTIDGSAGNDTMLGGTGTDALLGSAGNDSMDGNAGNDSIVYGATVLDFGTDILADSGAGEVDSIDFSAFPTPIMIDVSNVNAHTVSAGMLVIDLTANNIYENVTGSSYGDDITGNTLSNGLNGGDGDDTLRGLAGNDALTGGAGNDTFAFAGSGNLGTDSIAETANLDIDTLDFTAFSQPAGVDLGSTATQTIYFGVLSLTLSSATGLEKILGSASGDVFTGNARDNILEGNAGDDTLTGSTGGDTYAFSGTTNLGTDVVTEGASADADVLDFSGFGQGAAVALATTGNQTVYTGKLILNLTTSTGIENVLGSSSADQVTGNTRPNLLIGNGGSDGLNGASGDDTLASGNDTLDGGTGDDTLAGGNGNDTYVFSGSANLGTDSVTEAADVDTDALDFSSFGQSASVTLSTTSPQTIYAGALILSLSSSTGLEKVVGSAFPDSVTGNSRNNILDGSAGDDTLTGGTGNDTYIFSGGGALGTDSVTENADVDTDTLDFTGFAYAIDLDIAATSNPNVSPGLLGLNISSVSGVENVVGTASDDILRGNARANSLQGLAGHDSLRGADGGDTLAGGDGDDTLEGGLGNDSLDGNAGNDRFVFSGTADLGTDTVNNFTGSDQDTLDFSVFGQAAAVNLSTTNANQTISAGKLVLYLAIAGSNDFDHVVGSAYADTITGNSINNQLEGIAGADTIDGGSGADTLDGGTGDDSLLGGAGDDLFRFYRPDTVTDLGADQLMESAGNGTDVLIFADFLEGVSVDLSATAQQTAASGKLRLTLNNNATFENATGSSSDDWLKGNGGANLIQGGDGADTLIGMLGDDTLSGQDGNDHYFYDEGWNHGSDVILESASEDVDALILDEFDSPSAIDISLTTAQTVRAGVLTLTLSSGTGIENVDAGSATGAVTIAGNTRDNVLIGGPFADELSGADGNDNIVGGSGNDTISGGLGNDTLTGGLGTDSLDGGSGSDVYSFSSGALGTDNITESATADEDSLDLTYLQGAAVLNLATTGNQTVSSGYLILNLNDATGIENVIGTASGDSVTGNSRNNLLQGLGGNDTLDGGSGDDSLEGGAGDDSLVGNSGNDRFVFKGASNLGADIINEAAASETDTLDFADFDHGVNLDLNATGNQTVASGDLVLNLSTSTGVENVMATNHNDGSILTGNSRNNYFAGGAIYNEFYGGAGDDTLIGSIGPDYLYGESGNDSLVGGGHDDYIVGDTENDTLVGGAGNDQYIFSGSGDLGTDAIIEATDVDFDIVDLTAFGQAASIDLARIGDQTVSAGKLVVNLDGAAAIEDIYGTAYGDTLIGNARSNRIIGNQGNDILQGGSGDDTYVYPFGGFVIDLGTDYIVETAGADADTLDFFWYGAGITVDLGTTGNQTVLATKLVLNLNSSCAIENITGSGGADTLRGNIRNNVIKGNAGNDSLYGFAGDDTLEGEGGSDRLEGGAGSDSYKFTGTSDLATDTIFESAGVDSDALDFSTFGQALSALNLSTTGNQTVHSGKLILNLETTSDGLENVIGTAYGDNVTGNSRDNRLEGLAGADTLSGSTGSDSLLGGDGDDSLSGGDGDDMLDGGAGNDTVLGGNQNDSLLGGDGADSLSGGSGNDTLEGGLSNDTLDGGDNDDTYRFSGTDNLGTDSVIEAADDDLDTIDFSAFGYAALVNIGTTGNQTVSAGTLVINLNSSSGIENVIGTQLADNITGNARKNLLQGIAGDDTLSGSSENDTIWGGAGADLIHGDSGNDCLIGHEDVDTIYGDGGDDTLWSGSGTASGQSESLNGGDGNDLVDGSAG